MPRERVPREVLEGSVMCLTDSCDAMEGYLGATASDRSDQCDYAFLVGSISRKLRYHRQEASVAEMALSHGSDATRSP